MKLGIAMYLEARRDWRDAVEAPLARWSVNVALDWLPPRIAESINAAQGSSQTLILDMRINEVILFWLCLLATSLGFSSRPSTEPLLQRGDPMQLLPANTDTNPLYAASL
jgi:hypothetical protein